ncbi:phage holin family protein [uncultured Arcticibacterium sp.]|uniref:phage holin family protein n=1 Tax=uncultured Arcticibacterium sp. TaxID=2173042 RepID=UPI0030FBA4EA
MSLKSSIGDLFKLGEIKDSVISLIEAKLELKKIEIQEKAERGVAELIFAILLMVLGSMVLVFVLIMAAFGLNVWLGEPFGYLTILVLLLITLAVVFNKKKEIKEMITETIQKEMDAMDS